MAGLGEIGSSRRVLAGAMVLLLIGLAAVEAEQAPSTRVDGQVVHRHCRLPLSYQEEIRPVEPSLKVLVPIGGPISVAGKTFRDDEIDNLFRAAFQHDRKTGVVLIYE